MQVTFGDVMCREPLIGVEKVVGGSRRGLVCGVCGLGGKGVCLQCSHPDCSESFHATCAQLIGGWGGWWVDGWLVGCLAS